MIQNYHKEAFRLQEEIEAIEKEIERLNELIKEYKPRYDECLQAAIDSGERENNGFRIKSETKIRNSNVILIDKIKAEKPEILWNTGTYALPAVDVAWTDAMKERYLNSFDYSAHYELLLGQLDKYLGKKEAEEFKEKVANVTVVNKIVRVEPEPEDIIEVD